MLQEKERTEVEKILSSFSCEKNKDTQDFLHNRAIDFELLSKSRTYLIFNKDQFLYSSNKPDIYGYISLALKVLSLPESISNRIRKDIDGFSSKIQGKPIQNFPCYLIGQLSRNTNVPKSSLPGEQLLHFAYDIISTSVNAIGGRYIMLECHDDPKLIQFYKNNSFREIASIPDFSLPQAQMVQMIRKI